MSEVPVQSSQDKPGLSQNTPRKRHHASEQTNQTRRKSQREAAAKKQEKHNFQTSFKPSTKGYDEDYPSESSSDSEHKKRWKKHKTPESDSSSTDLTSTPYIFTTDSEEILLRDDNDPSSRRLGFHKRLLPRTYSLLEQDSQAAKHFREKHPNIPPNEPLFVDWNDLIFTKKQVDERERIHAEKKRKLREKLARLQQIAEKKRKDRFYRSSSWSCLLIALQTVGLLMFTIIALLLFKEHSVRYIRQHIRVVPDDDHSFKLEIPVCAYL